MSISKSTIAACVGLLSHQAIFIRGEWHRRAPGLCVLALALPFTLWILDLRHGFSTYEAFKDAIYTTENFFGALFASMVIYRVYFHPLRKYPGPFWARATKLWHFYHCRHRQNHLLLEKMRRKYGNYVRIGPNEIAIFTADALDTMDKPKSPFTRAPFYDFMLPEISLETTRSVKVHDWRRKIWNQALTDNNLNIYHERVLKHANILESIIGNNADAQQVVSIGTLFQRFSFDCMGDIMFSHPFDTLKSKEWRDAIELLRGATGFLGKMAPLPWLHQICNVWLEKLGSFNGLKMWGLVQIEKRMQHGTEHQDWASHAIREASKQGSSPEELNCLKGDSILLIPAGSDPPTAALSSAFYRLAMHPEKADKVYQEIRTVDYTDRKALKKCQYLEAFLMEMLRLHPVILTGGLRDSPPEGATIGDKYIPGNVTIQVPRYSIARSEECFVRPNEFIPERWTSEPHLILDKRGHLPFGQGRYMCVGRRIAFMELRMVITMILTRYTVRPAPGEYGERFERETLDEFGTLAGPFDALFTRREIV